MWQKCNSRHEAIMRTWEEIAEKVKETENLHREWEDDASTPTVEFERREVIAVTQKIDRAWNELYDLVDGQDAEPAAYKLVMLMDDWIDEVDKFRDNPRANPGGTAELWKAWDEVKLHAKQKPQPQMLESISYLARVQKVTPRQIAKMYLWKDEFGDPDTRRVLDVIESGIDEPTPNPSWQKAQDELKDQWERRQSRKRQDRTVVEKPKQTDPIRIAPESMETLLEQGVPSKQIARMKNVDQQTVIDYARELGVPVDGVVPGPSLTPEQHLSQVREKENAQLAAAKEHLKTAADAAEARERDGEINTYSEIGNYKEQVRQMAFDGCTKQQIVTHLKEQHPDKCKPSSVAQIMAAIEREAAANGE